MELPTELRSALEGGPLGPLLQGAGVRLGSPDGRVTIEGPLAQAARRLVYLYRHVDNTVHVSIHWLLHVSSTCHATNALHVTTIVSPHTTHVVLPH